MQIKVDLSRKVAFIRGGSRGIGAAIARRLAAERTAVAITCVNAADKAKVVVDDIEAAGRRAIVLNADSADAGALTASFRMTVEKLGRLDILVNNAGVLAVAPLDQFSLDDFDRSLAANLRSVFAASQEAARHMSDGGRIINIGSTNADRVPFAGGGPYAMSTSALVGLTRRLARVAA